VLTTTAYIQITVQAVAVRRTLQRTITTTQAVQVVIIRAVGIVLQEVRQAVIQAAADNREAVLIRRQNLPAVTATVQEAVAQAAAATMLQEVRRAVIRAVAVRRHRQAPQKAEVILMAAAIAAAVRRRILRDVRHQVLHRQEEVLRQVHLRLQEAAVLQADTDRKTKNFNSNGL
jgi:hypothetical protein